MLLGWNSRAPVLPLQEPSQEISADAGFRIGLCLEGLSDTLAFVFDLGQNPKQFRSGNNRAFDGKFSNQSRLHLPRQFQCAALIFQEICEHDCCGDLRTSAFLPPFESCRPQPTYALRRQQKRLDVIPQNRSAAVRDGTMERVKDIERLH